MTPLQRIKADLELLWDAVQASDPKAEIEVRISDLLAFVIERANAAPAPPPADLRAAIGHEICLVLARLGADVDLQAVVNSYGDTLDDAEVLQLLKDFNETGKVIHGPPRPLLALTIWQPWASLIVAGAKPYEFRGASYQDRKYYRLHPQPGERIVIHAAAREVRPAEIEDLLARLGTGADKTGLVVEPARKLLERVQAAYRYRLLPLGAGLGTAVIGTPRNAGAIFGDLRHDSDRGDFNWAWPLTEIRTWEEPVPMRGQQGFWTWHGRMPEDD